MNQPNPEAIAQLATPLPGSGAAAPANVQLTREVDKWRERTARLLTALRERSGEVEQLQQALAEARARVAETRQPVGTQAPGARAREVLIEELERELAGLREAHAALQGDLHARSLTIGGLKRDLQGWKDKWHELARRLDGASTANGLEHARVAELTASQTRLNQELATLRRTLAELSEERDALAARNANLFETTDLANRQMEVLADDLADLRAQLREVRVRHDAARAEADALLQERSDLRQALAVARAEADSLDQLLQSLQAAALLADADARAADRAAVVRLAELETAHQQLQAELSASATRSERLAAALAAAEGGRADADAARAEAERLGARAVAACREAEAALAVMERARDDALAAERRAALDAREAGSARDRQQQLLDHLQVRQQQLEHQLAERSALVLGLEQELTERSARGQALEAERDALQSDLDRSTRNAREQADYVQQLDDRLERQKALLLSLEQELAAAQDRLAAGARQHELDTAARDAEIRALRIEVGALRSMLQEPGAVQPGAAPARETAESARLDPHSADAVRVERDVRTLRVLNQQLRDARARNEALLARIRELESGPDTEREAQPGDDLTRIRGVGPRLAQHLRTLGVDSYRQLAELDPDALANPEHALAALRSRILRDGWIEQAASLHRH